MKEKKRNTMRACLECRKSHRRCNFDQRPCSRCVDHGFQCSLSEKEEKKDYLQEIDISEESIEKAARILIGFLKRK
jgi:hypothetical protein